jgi:dGTPase
MTGTHHWLGPPWSERRSGDVDARPGDWRRWYERDRARIIHGSAFRGLQTKTQLLGMGGSDFHRTRLTHSLETAQIAQGIVGKLAADATIPDAARDVLPPPALMEAIALAHDLGHPPFGHGGEIALNWCMRRHGGFEGNGQTLRLIARLEAHSGPFGLDLARRTMLGVLKYPRPRSRDPWPPDAAMDVPMRAADWRPVKSFFDADLPVVDWIFAPFTPGERTLIEASRAGAADCRALDTSLLELADDIAYGVHDLEDAIVLRLIAQDQVQALWAAHRADVAGLDGVPEDATIAALFADDSARKRAIGLLVNFFIVHIGLRCEDAHLCPLLAWTGVLAEPAAALLRAFIGLMRRQVIEQPVVQMLEFRGQEIVRRLFDTIAGDPARFLPPLWRGRWRAACDETEAMRTLCDYLSAMTDEQATRNFELLFAARGSGLAFGLL